LPRHPWIGKGDERMPYKHPILGVQCMTLGEFCAEEIARTGKDPIEEAFRGMDEDSRRAEEQFRDPREALRLLVEYSKRERECCDFEPGQEPPWPLAIREVLESKFSQGFSHSSQRLVAVVLCTDGEFRKATLRTDDWAGTYMEPPEDDWVLVWEPADFSGDGFVVP
jgi:hypothetical protein